MAELFSPDKEIIKGWNSKTQASSLQLSNLVPFINLVALFHKDDINALSDSDKTDLLASSFAYGLKNDKSNLFGDGEVTSVAGVPLARPQSQIQSQNFKGGVGINNLNITRGTKESFNVRYDMDLTITDPEVFDTNIEYNNLIELNSIFLLMYGWTGSKGELFLDPPEIFEKNAVNEIDLEAPNGGFWKAELVRLYKFDFSFDETGFVNVKLGFMSPHTAAMAFIKSSALSSAVNKKLNNVEASTDFLSSQAKEIISRDPALKKPFITTKIVKKVEQPEVTFEEGEEDGDPIAAEIKPPEITETAEYYYLGWVLESIRDAVNNDNSKDKLNVDFLYDDILENNAIVSLYSKWYDPEAGTNNYGAKKLTNVFEIPIYKTKFDSMMLTQNTPVFQLIREVLDDNSHALPGIQLGSRMENGITRIFIASANIEGLEVEIKQKSYDRHDKDISNDKVMYINFGSKNSLCDSIDLTSKLDPNAFEIYKLPVPVSGSIVDLLDDARIKNSGLDVDIRAFLEKEKIKDNDRSIDAPSVISKFISQDTRNYKRVVRALLEEQDVFGHLLGFYLKRTSITIHGTCGINAYNLIVIQGVVKRLSGTYNILQISEQINRESYQTVIEAALRDPFTKKREKV
jgi:hypothetical protein